MDTAEGNEATMTINHKLVRIALEHVTSSDFEHFAQAFLSAILGTDLVPTGGQHDGGADALIDSGLFQRSKTQRYVQASIQHDYKGKIRHTVRRLREVGRDPSAIIYASNQSLNMPDLDEELLSEELGVSIRIRARDWFVMHANASRQTQAAFETFLRPHIAFLSDIGGATLISSSNRVPSRAICVFLGQETERRSGQSALIESVTDSLILWALGGTNPDEGKFLQKGEILGRIVDALPSTQKFIRGTFDHRLSVLSSKRNPTGREIRYYRKGDKFCLPHETRQLIEMENIEDEGLKVQVLEEFGRTAQSILGEQGCSLDAIKIAELSLHAIELTFENSGLELAAFLHDDRNEMKVPTITNNVETVLDDSGLPGQDAIAAKGAIIGVIRTSFYESTECQRIYFGKLSRTYTLLFSLQTEPRIVEYFQSMSSQLSLFVGTDILVRALSERYLRPEDQMTCNMLKILRDAGSQLILCEPNLNEVISHLRATDFEFRNHFSTQEPYITLEIARHAEKILIRSYFYARLQPVEQGKGPRGWKSHIARFCDYDQLHTGKGSEQLRQYLLAHFGLEFLSDDDLAKMVSEEEVKKLAEQIFPHKAQEILATTDARVILGVYGQRDHRKEAVTANPYGFSTWWLTQETAVQKATFELVRDKHAKYIIRPDFLLNFIALSPSMESVRKTYRSVFPSLLGVRLANRMREDIFHDVMGKAREAMEVDEARAVVIMSELSNKLKGDSYKQYEQGWAQHQLA